MGKCKRHIPVRTCISCGAGRGKAELIRLVLDAENLVVQDQGGKEPGRGAYVCGSRSCFTRLARNKRLNRAFRKEGPVHIHPGLLAEWNNHHGDVAAR